MFSGTKIVQIFRSTKCLADFLVIFSYRPQMFFIDHRLTQIGTDYEPKARKIERLMIILGTDEHGFKKARLGCAMGMA